MVVMMMLNDRAQYGGDLVQISQDLDDENPDKNMGVLQVLDEVVEDTSRTQLSDITDMTCDT